MNAAAIYNGLKYTTREINQNFKIKLFGVIDDRKVNTLVGVAGLVEIVGTELANKLFDRAFNSVDDKQVCKLRRGIKITFYVH